MARRKKASVNRSEAIRTYLASNAKASPSEIKAAMKEKGIDVSDSLVAAVKYKQLGRKGRGRRGRRKGGRKAAATNSTISVEHLVTAKQLVDRLGGIEAAGKAIDVLKKLQG